MTTRNLSTFLEKKNTQTPCPQALFLFTPRLPPGQIKKFDDHLIQPIGRLDQYFTVLIRLVPGV